jgi:DNA polymerase III delta subunit
VPALDVSAIRQHINARKLAPVYLFVGEDVRLVERMVDAVEATVDPADQPFAVERLYAGEAGGSPVDISAAARAFPMLGDRRIVFVLRAERLLKPKRAAKSSDADEEDGVGAPDDSGLDLTALEDYLGAPVPSTTLVFVATEIDRTRRFTKRVLEKALVVGFSGIAGDGPAGRRDARAAGVDLAREEMLRARRAIDPAALNMLVDRAGGDITKLRGDIERLLLYTEGRSRISSEDVAEVASAGESVADDWAVVNAIADGDAGRALREIASRLDRGDSPHAVVGQLRWWVSARLVESAPDRVRPAVDALLRTDLALKSSAGDQRLLVERLVIELTGAPLPRRGWR